MSSCNQPPVPKAPKPKVQTVLPNTRRHRTPLPLEVSGVAKRVRTLADHIVFILQVRQKYPDRPPIEGDHILFDALKDASRVLANLQSNLQSSIQRRRQARKLLRSQPNHTDALPHH